MKIYYKSGKERTTRNRGLTAGKPVSWKNNRESSASHPLLTLINRDILNIRNVKCMVIRNS